MSQDSKKPEQSAEEKPSNVIIGNIGLFHVCRELSRRGLNVVPTSRNTPSIDVIIGTADFSRHVTIQVKTSTVGYGTKMASSIPGKKSDDAKKEAILKSKLADFWVFVRIDKRHGYAICETAVCEGGDSVLLVYDRAHWWYNPWSTAKDKVVAEKWDAQKDEAGWKLISDRLSAQPANS